MAEIDLTLALAGAHSIRDLDPSWLVQRGVVLRAPGAVALEEIEVREPGPGEVLVRIEATGVCHSDLHVIEEDGWGHALPVLLGHEGAGTVEAVGEGVASSRPGDRVVLGWKTACGGCRNCLRGEPSAVRPAAGRDGPAASGTTASELTPVLRTGTFATHTVVPAVAAVKMPRRAAGRAGVPDRLCRRDRRACRCSRRQRSGRARALR